MEIEVAAELKNRLTFENTGLEVAATYATSAEVLKNYLNRPYGNAYDFDQIDRIQGVF